MDDGGGEGEARGKESIVERYCSMKWRAGLDLDRADQGP